MKVKSGQRYFKSMHMSGTGKLPLVPEADVVLVHFAAELPISPVFLPKFLFLNPLALNLLF